MTAVESDRMIEPEFESHFLNWQEQRSPASTAAFLTAISPILDNAVKTYGGSSPGPTVKTKAKLIALKAAEGYDPKRAKLRTHLMTHLQGLRRVAAREAQPITVPERVALDAHRAYRSEAELRDRLGRIPSVSELADETGLSLRRLGHVTRSRPVTAEGSLMSAGEGGPEQFNPSVTGSPAGWHEFVYHDLGPIDQVVMEHTLGLHGRPILPKQVIARKLGVSPGAVSQRAARIQALLDRRDELDPFQ